MSIMMIGPIVVDDTLGLMELARAAVGERNFYNICPSIPFKNLKHAKGGGGVMYPMLAPCLVWETAEKAAERLVIKGYVLGNIGELAQVTARWPKEIAKYSAVFALDKDSRWLNSDGDVCVSYTSVEGLSRRFGRHRFDHLLDPEDCTLVFRQVGHRFLALAPAVL